MLSVCIYLLPCIRWSVAEDPEYKEFQADVRQAQGGSQPQETQGDDDDDEIVIDQSQVGLAPNAKCPLSGRLVSVLCGPS